MVLAVAGLMATAAMGDGPAKDANLIELRGTFVEGGVECPLFQVDGGPSYALQGIDRSIIRIGAKAVLIGRLVEFSTCQQGDAFAVNLVRLIETP
jgi:hypothetical protein